MEVGKKVIRLFHAIKPSVAVLELLLYIPKASPVYVVREVKGPVLGKCV